MKDQDMKNRFTAIRLIAAAAVAALLITQSAFALDQKKANAHGSRDRRQTESGLPQSSVQASDGCVNQEVASLTDQPPDVTIREMIADDTRVELNEKVELEPDIQRIEFHYAGLSFRAPRSMFFKYKLEGFDNKWIDAGSRKEAYYTRVPAGNYCFRVMACNDGGVWKEAGASFSFHIRPRLYQTYWFYGACAGCLILMAAAGFRLRVKQMRAREGNLVRLVMERTRQLEEAKRNLEQLSYLDSLTGISNRRRFEEVLDVEWRRACRVSAPLSLIMIDIDYFKSYNDAYGHQRGDYCLKRVAETLNNSLQGAGDLAARYGGEEFAVILPESEAHEAALLGEELREKIEALEIPHETPAGCVLTISVGVATVYPEKELSVISLLSAADQALYRAKYEGRNQVLISDSSRLLNPFDKPPGDWLNN
jgi:diguanylate cyclase (GGDEF)-like protein